MTDEEQVMAVKLALVGVGIWSRHEWLKSIGDPPDGAQEYSVVTIDTLHKSGTFFWEDKEGRQFFETRTQAMEYALKRLSIST